MSNIRTNREFIFNLYLYFNICRIEELVGYSIRNLELEKNFNGRKIDLFGKDGNKQIFIETQITRADEVHLKQIKFIVDNVDVKSDNIIVWIAEGFQNQMIDSIEEYIRESNKSIEFITLNLIDGPDRILEILEPTGELGIIENLWKLDGIIEMELVSRYFRKSNVEILDLTVIEENNKTDKEIILENILKEIRRQIFYFPTVYRDKKLDGNVIVLGSGFSEINYAMCINRNNEIVTELRFNTNTKDIFERLLEYQHEIEDYLDYNIEWDYEFFRIYSVQYYEGKERVIKQQVRILEKLINYFTTFMNSFEHVEEDVG